MSEIPSDINAAPKQQWPPSRTEPLSAQAKKPRVSSGSLKDRIAKFNDLSAGSAPLLPNAPFGLGTPPSHAQSQARGGLIGNRIPSMDPKTAGILPGAVSGIIKPESPSLSNMAAPKLHGRSNSPAQSVASSATSADPAATDSLSPATSRSTSPSGAPAQSTASSQLVISSLPVLGDGTATPSSTMAEASESSTSLPLSTEDDVLDSLSKKNLQLNAESLPGMDRQDSNASAQASLVAPSISSMQAQYEPSSTGSGEVTKMIDVSGVSTPMGTPRAAQRDLASDQGSQHDDGSVNSDVEINRISNTAGELPISSDLREIRLRQTDAALNPTAEIEDIVGQGDQFDKATPSQTVTVERSEVEPSDATFDEAGTGPHILENETVSQGSAQGPLPSATDLNEAQNGDGSIDNNVTLPSHDRVTGADQTLAPEVDVGAQTSPDQVAAVVELDEADQGSERDLSVIEDDADPLEKTNSRASTVEDVISRPIDHSGDVEATIMANKLPNSEEEDAKMQSTSNTAVSTKPRARLGPTEVVYLPNSDSEEDDEDDLVRSDDEGADKQDGDFLSAHPDETEDLHLRHMRLTTESLAPLRLPRFGQHLRRLCLRQNALTSPLPHKAFDGMSALEELDMYDNRLGPEVTNEEVKGCLNIKILDLSFNNLRKAPNLPDLKHVETLYLVQNKITSIQEGELDWCRDTMRSLELGGNRLRRIENIEKLVHLDELWLGKNKIRVLENLDTFSNLKILSMQSNRITKICGLEGLVNLEELYFSHNGLTKLEGLESNVKLRTLDVGNNQIAKIENISHLKSLEEFWASYNLIPDLRDLDRELANLPALETVYLEGNPCQKNDMAGYRRKVILALPNIKQIDANYVQPVPYAMKSTSPVDQGAQEVAKIQELSRSDVPTEDGAPLEAASKFPSAPTETPTEAAGKSGQDVNKPSTPLDPAFLKSFPSVPASSDNSDPSKLDSDKVRVQVIVPPSPERLAGVQSDPAQRELFDDAVDRSGSGESATATNEESTTNKRSSLKKIPPKSPLLDDEDPGDFEEGWAVVTKGREA